MIVCVCKAVSDRVIRARIADGAATFEELQMELGVAACCGKCERAVRDVLIEADAATQPARHEELAVATVRFYERVAA
ncbi:MAG: (2Fe-2S)-binding protein [Janthinobacterium lividum]